MSSVDQRAAVTVCQRYRLDALLIHVAPVAGDASDQQRLAAGQQLGPRAELRIAGRARDLAQTAPVGGHGPKVQSRRPIEDDYTVLSPGTPSGIGGVGQDGDVSAGEVHFLKRPFRE